MNDLQKLKFVSITPPAAIVDNAAYTTAIIDTKGADKMSVLVYLGATDIAMAALKVQESDASDMTGAADITGLVCGTSTAVGGSASTLPSATDDNKFVVFDIDLKGRKRYIDLVATAGDGTAGTYLAALAILQMDVVPYSATDRGVLQVLRA